MYFRGATFVAEVAAARLSDRGDHGFSAVPCTPTDAHGRRRTLELGTPGPIRTDDIRLRRSLRCSEMMSLCAEMTRIEAVGSRERDVLISRAAY